jgi:hypothetical protein
MAGPAGKEWAMKSIKSPFSLVLVVALVSLACGLPLLPAATPLDTPTPDALMTALVETLTAIYAPTEIPSATWTPLPPTKPPTETQIPFPTITPIPSFTPMPSFTPFGTLPPNLTLTLALTPGDGDGGTAEFKCKVLFKSPENGEVFKPRKDFDGLWKIRNVGTKNWQTGNVILTFIDGAKFHQGGQTSFKIPSDIKVGEDGVIIADFVTPKEKGNYTAHWGLMEVKTKQVFCKLTVFITVK